MKYIGPFLRINTINKLNIDNQMYYLAKESLKHLTLESHCGISITPRELCKSCTNIDINTIKNFSPLLCIYKKASPKLVFKDEFLQWNDQKFNKKIDIFGNSLMTLALLELVEYYSKFEGVDEKKYDLSKLYLNLSQKQLEFYASNLRNSEGVFVDKTDISESLIDDPKFEETSKNFKYSNQAFLMCAYYKYSTYDEKKIGQEYKNFAFDILNMFLEFKEEIYDLSNNELIKLCIAMNIFYDYSKDLRAKTLMLDLCDLISENYINKLPSRNSSKLENDCMLYINYMLMYNNTDMVKFKEDAENVFSKIIKLYNDDMGVFIKNSDERKVGYSCSEIVLYLYTLIIHSDICDDRNCEHSIGEIYKHQIINSGLILSWPDSPPLNDCEKYRNFTLKSDDLIDDNNFRMPTLPTPENNELAPIFIKRVMFNKKKGVYKQNKLSFDSNKNMLIYFMSIYYHNHKKSNQ